MVADYFAYARQRIIDRTNNEVNYYEKYRQELSDKKTYLITHGTIVDSQIEINHLSRVINMTTDQIRRIKESASEEMKMLEDRASRWNRDV